MNHDAIEILFVEDNIDDATLTLRALKKGGLTNTIYHVRDGAEALDFLFCKGEYVSRNIPEDLKLILLDLKMPKMTGMEVLERIKSDPKLKSIPVVILTSSKEDPDIKKCYELGANSYIVKPLESESFFLTIKELGLYWMISNQVPQ